MRLPNLIIVGTGRAGTTATLTVLDRHPDIWMYFKDKISKWSDGEVKNISEIDFFSANYNKGTGWYAQHFDAPGVDYNNYKYIGEKSPSYVSHENDCAGRIKKELGDDVKIIYCVRDPAERAFSQWAHLQDKPYGKYWDNYRGGVSFSEAIRIKDKPHVPQGNLLLQYSDYAEQYSKLLKVFRKDQIYVIVNEETKLRPVLGYDKLYSWLEVNPHDVTEGKNIMPLVNISHYSKYGYLRDEDREKINSDLKESKDKFYSLLGREIKLWEV